MLKLTKLFIQYRNNRKCAFFRNKNKTFFVYDIELHFTNEFTYQFGCSVEIDAVLNIFSLYRIHTAIKVVIASHGQINKCS